MKKLRVYIEVPEARVSSIDVATNDINVVLDSKVVDEYRWGTGREHTYRPCQKVVSIPREYCEWING